MPEVLAALDAFLQEHRRSGDLEAGVEPALVWMACDCGAELVRVLDEPSKDKQACCPGTPRLSLRLSMAS
jgi:hypothetical protein